MTAVAPPGGSLLFRCAERLLALPMAAVDEVFRMVAMAARLPRAPRHVLGVVDCRGRLVPVIDLGARLGLCPPRDVLALADGHVVVLHDRVGAVGYAVDEVRELSEAAPEPLDAAGGPRAALVPAAIRLGDGSLAPLLDPPALLTARARHGLRQALAALGAGS